MKKICLVLIKILASLLIIIFLVKTSKLDFHLFTRLADNLPTLILIITIYFISVAVSAWRWFRLNDAQGITVPYSKTLLPTYLGIAFNNILPGGIGGDFFRLFFINKVSSVTKSAMLLSIMFDRVTGLLGIFICVCLSLSWHTRQLMQQKVILYFIITSLIICAFIGGILTISSLLPANIGVSKWLKQKYATNNWVQSIISLLEAIRAYRKAKLVIVECLLASVIVQVLIVIICMLIANSMHFPSLAFFDYVMAVAVTQLVNLIPITPGGFGLGEFAFAKTLSLLNPQLIGTSATIFLAYRIIGIITYLPGLAIFIFDKNLLYQTTTKKTRSLTQVTSTVD